VANTFDEVIAQRKAEGLRIDANFIGVREVTLTEATFDRDRRLAEISVRFVGELTSVVRDETGAIVEGNPNEIKRQRDVWTFAREMGADDPNWHLVATGE
jgi:predicted lipid-binding transport protein (Tim44 family)